MPRIVRPPGSGAKGGERLMNSPGGQAEGGEPSRTGFSGRQGPWGDGLAPKGGGGRWGGREAGGGEEGGSISEMAPYVVGGGGGACGQPDGTGSASADRAPSPRRASRSRSRWPPGETPTIRRPPPQLGHRRRTRAKTRFNNAAHESLPEAEAGVEVDPSPATTPGPAGPTASSTAFPGVGIICARQAA